MLPRRLLRRLRSTADLGTGSTRLLSVTRRTGARDPSRFLGQAPGRPRGFWGTGDEWVAHVGAAARLEVHVDPPQRTNGTNGHATFDAFDAADRASTTERLQLPTDQADQRFQRVRDTAAGLLAEVRSEGDVERTPRLYGGFSFHDEHHARRHWRQFPTASFVLPRLELDSNPDGATLTYNELLPPSESRSAGRRRAHTTLDRALEALERPPASNGHGHVGELRQGAPQNGWHKAIESALHDIRSKHLEKVVVARTMEVPAGPHPDPVAVLQQLRAQNPKAHVYLFEPRPGSAFVGASPEIIAQAHGQRFHATAVAGSIARGATPDQDEALAQQLLQSSKDQDEHRLVVEHMRDRLADLTRDLELPGSPRVLRLSRIQHLETPLDATLAPDVHVLDVLARLHPTPAVCGTPRDRALGFLRGTEPFERGWYAGPVGWFDASGDGSFAPGLRSAVLQDDEWRLFAGAGIVEGSDPLAEWNETGVKFEPVLQALRREDGT